MQGHKCNHGTTHANTQTEDYKDTVSISKQKIKLIKCHFIHSRSQPIFIWRSLHM